MRVNIRPQAPSPLQQEALPSLSACPAQRQQGPQARHPLSPRRSRFRRLRLSSLLRQWAVREGIGGLLIRRMLPHLPGMRMDQKPLDEENPVCWATGMGCPRLFAIGGGSSTKRGARMHAIRLQSGGLSALQQDRFSDGPPACAPTGMSRGLTTVADLSFLVTDAMLC